MVETIVTAKSTVTRYKIVFTGGWERTGFQTEDAAVEQAERTMRQVAYEGYEIVPYEIAPVAPLRQRRCAGCGEPSGIMWWCSDSCRRAEDGDDWDHDD